MGHFENRRKAKIEKYKERLQQNYRGQEISTLVSMYEKVVRLSNIFIFNIIMIVTSVLLIILAAKINNISWLNKSKDIIFWVFGSISGIFVIISFVLTLLVFLKVAICNIKEVRKKVLIWAILSLLPAISFVTTFIMKWKIGHMYKYRK